MSAVRSAGHGAAAGVGRAAERGGAGKPATGEGAMVARSAQTARLHSGAYYCTSATLIQGGATTHTRVQVYEEYTAVVWYGTSHHRQIPHGTPVERSTFTA